MENLNSRNIAIRIIEARREKGLTQIDLANKSGVHRTTIIRYESTNNKNVKLENLEKIANAMGKNVAYFINEKEFEIKKFSSEQIHVKKIPLISWISANRFGEASDPLPPGAADDWVYTTTKGERIFALKIKHDCMEPEFREGETIIVDPDGRSENGDFVIVRDNKKDEATFKQLKKYGKKTILHPLNPKYPDIELDYDERYVIVGKVVGKDKKY